MPFSQLYDAVKSHFFSSDALARVDAMTTAEVQVEGWWKGEIILLLNHLQQKRVVVKWDRECPTGFGRQKLDFKIQMPTAIAAVEMKTAIGYQKKITYPLSWYACDPNRYFPLDIRKLAAIPLSYRFLLVFAYPAPSQIDWNSALVELNGHACGAVVTLARVDTSSCGKLSVGWFQVNQAQAGAGTGSRVQAD